MDSWKELEVGIFVHYHCRTTNPQKPKFALVVAVNDEAALVFLVNSDLAEFIQRRAELLNQQIALFPSDYNFLSHDSWLDCHTAHVLSGEDIAETEHLCCAPESLCIQVAQIAAVSKTLNRRSKAAISSAFAHLSPSSD